MDSDGVSSVRVSRYYFIWVLLFIFSTTVFIVIVDIKYPLLLHSSIFYRAEVVRPGFLLTRRGDLRGRHRDLLSPG